MSKKPSANPARPDSKNQDMENAYAQMAREKKREAEALEWSEALIGDVSDDEAQCSCSLRDPALQGVNAAALP